MSAVPAPLIRSLGRTFRQVGGQLREGLAERLRRSWEPAVRAALEDEEDDVHKSLKYEIWSSTDPGNKRLDKAFKENNGRGPIYLFFSVNARYVRMVYRSNSRD